MKELEQFKKEWLGKRIDIDNYGGFQCVDLVRAWSNYIGVPTGSFNGSAFNGWLKDMKGWKKVEKGEWLKPNPGDILFWNKTKSNPYGHTSVCTREGGRLWLTHLEQNGGKGTGTGDGIDAIRERRTTYFNLLGWKTPKKPLN